MMTLCLNLDGLTPVAPLPLTGPLIAVIGVCLIAAVALITVSVALARRPAKRSSSPQRHGVHANAGSTASWHTRINAVVDQYESGRLEREAAFAALARIARDYASAVSGNAMHASTLADVSRIRRTETNREGLDLLRHTLAALYPPEFADAAFNRDANRVQVREAAGWVSNLVERWRR